MVERTPERSREQKITEYLLMCRDDYVKDMADYLGIYEKAAQEGWGIYDSGLSTKHLGNLDSGYFAPTRAWSYLGLDGFTSEKLVQYIVDYLTIPENRDKEILILDALGQGRPGTDLRKLVLKQLPSARITILASTLTPRRNTTEEVLEFNGDALSDTDSIPLFREIEKRKDTGAAFLVTFFRPGGGVSKFGENAYVQYALYKQLRRLFSATSPGGLLFLQSPSDNEELGFLYELLERYGAEKLLVRGQGSVGLLKKDASLCPDATLPLEHGEFSLPPAEELMSNHVDLLKEHWKIPSRLV